MTRWNQLSLLLALAGGCDAGEDVVCIGGSMLQNGVCRCPAGATRVDEECVFLSPSGGGDDGGGPLTSSGLDGGFKGTTSEDLQDGGCEDWYLDCDGDGYAAAGTIPALGCTAPSPPGGCQTWTKRAPRPGSFDCNDDDPNYRPGAGYGPAGFGDGDLNCDGVVQRETVLNDATTGPSEKGPVQLCTADLRCNCADDPNGGLFACSEDARDWRAYLWRQTGRGGVGCSVTSSETAKPFPIHGLQYCR